MSETVASYTPGPWWSEYSTVYALGSEGDAEAVAEIQSGLAKDAALIAVAPEMLDVLTDCAEILASMKLYGGELRARKRAQEIIALARGES